MGGKWLPGVGLEITTDAVVVVVVGTVAETGWRSFEGAVCTVVEDERSRRMPPVNWLEWAGRKEGRKGIIKGRNDRIRETSWKTS